MKNILKAIILILIVASFALTLAACGDKDKDGASSQNGADSGAVAGSDDAYNKLPFGGSGIDLPIVPLEPIPID